MILKVLWLKFCLLYVAVCYENKRCVRYVQITIANDDNLNDTNTTNNLLQKTRIFEEEISFRINSYIESMEYEKFESFASVITHMKNQKPSVFLFEFQLFQHFFKFSDTVKNTETTFLPKNVLWTKKILYLILYYAHDFFSHVVITIYTHGIVIKSFECDLLLAFQNFILQKDNQKTLEEFLTNIYEQCSKDKLKLHQIINVQMNDILIDKNIFCGLFRIIISKIFDLMCKSLEVELDSNYNKKIITTKNSDFKLIRQTLKEYPRYAVYWENILEYTCMGRTTDNYFQNIRNVVNRFTNTLQGIANFGANAISTLFVIKMNYLENILDYLIWSTKILEERQKNFSKLLLLELFAYFFGYKNEMQELCSVLSQIESALVNSMKILKISSNNESYFNLFFVKAEIEYDIKKRCDQIFAKYSRNFKKPYKFQKEFTELVTEFFDKYTKIFNNIFNSLNETVCCYYEALPNDIIEESNEVNQHVLEKIFNTKIKLKNSEQPKDFLNIILQDQKVWYNEYKNSIHNNKVIKKVSSYISKLKKEYMDKQKSVSEVEMSINDPESKFKNLINKFYHDKNVSKFQNEVLKQAISNAYSQLKQGTIQTKDTCKDLKSNNEIDKKTLRNNNLQINVPIADINNNNIVKRVIEKALLNKDFEESNKKIASKQCLVKNEGREHTNTTDRSLEKMRSQKQEIIDMDGLDCKENVDKDVIVLRDSVINCTVANLNKLSEYMGHSPSQSICSSEATNTTKGLDHAYINEKEETCLITNKITTIIIEDLDKKVILKETIKLNENLKYASEFDIVELQEEEMIKTIIDNEKEERTDQIEINENKQATITENYFGKAKKISHNTNSNKKSKKKKVIPKKINTTDCKNDSAKIIDPNVEAETNETMKNIEENTKTAINKTNSSDKITEFNKTKNRKSLTNDTNLCKNITSTSPRKNFININNTEITPNKMHPEQILINEREKERLPTLGYANANEKSNKKTDKKGNDRVDNLYKSTIEEQNELLNYLKPYSNLANDQIIEFKCKQNLEQISDGFENINANNDITNTVMQNIDNITTLEQLPETKKAKDAKIALLKLNDKNQSKNDKKKEEMISIGSIKREGSKIYKKLINLHEENKNQILQYKCNDDTNIVRIPKNLKNVEYKYFVYQKANGICYVYVPVYAKHDNNLLFIQTECNIIFPLVSIKAKYNHPIINHLNKYIEKNVDLNKGLNNYNCATTMFFSESTNILDNDYEFKIFECDIFYGTSCFVKSVKCIAQNVKDKLKN